MDLHETYMQLEGDYEVMLHRLNKEALIYHFLNAFLEDGEFVKLENALKKHDDKAAFEAAHTLKGVALNLELGFLSKSVIALTEALRGRKAPEADDLFVRVKEDYNKTVSIIKQLLDESTFS